MSMEAVPNVCCNLASSSICSFSMVESCSSTLRTLMICEVITFSNCPASISCFFVAVIFGG